MNDLKKSLEQKFDPTEWRGFNSFRSYKFTGENLIEEINSLDPDLVLDVGCGHNRFKGHIKNLIGFDQEPFPFADLQMSIEDAKFRLESADIALVLGSVQFGSKETIELQLDKIVSWVKPGGYIVMRTKQKRFRKNVDLYKDKRYTWSLEDVEYFTKKYELILLKSPVIEEVYKKDNEVASTKMSWWWQKAGERKKYYIDPVSCEIFER